MSGPPAPISWEIVTMAMISLLPVLGFERCGRDGDALAGDIVEHVDLIGESAAREDLEHLEGLFERAAGPTALHHPLDLVALEPHASACAACERTWHGDTLRRFAAAGTRGVDSALTVIWVVFAMIALHR